MSKMLEEIQSGYITDDGIVIASALNLMINELKNNLAFAQKANSKNVSYWENRIASVERVLNEKKFYDL